MLTVPFSSFSCPALRTANSLLQTAAMAAIGPVPAARPLQRAKPTITPHARPCCRPSSSSRLARLAPRASAVAMPRTRVLPSIPVRQIDESARDALARDLESELRGVRWDENPDRFDDISLAVLQQHVPGLLAELRGVLDDPAAPSAMLLTGLPQEGDLPTTPQAPPVKREKQLVEAMLMGFSRVWGRATGFPGNGPPGICRDLIAVQSNIWSSSTELVMHRDFGIAPEPAVPDVRLIYCLRPDKRREVQTLVADNRDVLAAMDPKDVQLLRSVPVKIAGGGLGGAKLMIQGSEELPTLSPFDMAVFQGAGTITSEDPAAVEAYHRMADAAMAVGTGVVLQEGDMLIISNSRAVHARTKSPHEQDGLGRWVKVTFAKAGAGPGEQRYLRV